MPVRVLCRPKRSCETFRRLGFGKCYESVDSLCRVGLQSEFGSVTLHMNRNTHKQLVRCAVVFVCSTALLTAEGGNQKLPGVTVIPVLPPAPGNPRNTEGSFVALRDGRILFAYSHFTGGGDDNDAAMIMGRYSSDGGRNWSSSDVPIVDREGDLNVMSVSLLRLKDRRVALFYVRKNSISDCRPYLRYSSDEG